MDLPPGLTCGHCAQPLYPHTACRTDYGWMHATACPSVKATPKADRAAALRQATADRIEDLLFMATHGESLAGAADRQHTTERAIELFLNRNGHAETLKAMRRRNPRDHNTKPDGSNIASLTSTPVLDAKIARRSERRKAARRDARTAA